MTTSHDVARLRAALNDHLESVMTVTDTERELARFRASVSRTGNRRRLLALAASVAVVAAGAGAYLALRDTAGATLPAVAGGAGDGLTGSGVLTIRESDGQPSDVTRQVEYRDTKLDGPVVLATADGERTAQLALTSNAGVVEGSDGVAVFHGSGEASMTLDGATCRGSWASSYYQGSSDGGGSIHLACDDGTVLGAAMVVERIGQHEFSNLWQLGFQLENGFLVEG